MSFQGEVCGGSLPGVLVKGCEMSQCAEGLTSWIISSTVQGTILPPGTQYVPMIWKASDATPANVAIAKQSGSGVLLGFNEPDLPAQADNSVSVSSSTSAWSVHTPLYCNVALNGIGLSH